MQAWENRSGIKHETLPAFKFSLGSEKPVSLAMDVATGAMVSHGAYGCGDCNPKNHQLIGNLPIAKEVPGLGSATPKLLAAGPDVLGPHPGHSRHSCCRAYA